MFLDFFVSLWLLAQPLLVVICYLCIATVHQKLWLAGVEMNVYIIINTIAEMPRSSWDILKKARLSFVEDLLKII